MVFYVCRMDTLKRQFPVAGPENLDELWKIAVRFEEKTFTAAINQVFTN